MKSNTRGGSRGRSRGGDDETTKISKAMSYILRHGAAKEGIEMGTDGNVLVDDLLKKPNFKGVTVDKIRSIVENNDKQVRYDANN
jgi:2'-phosphotransferase